MTSRVVMPRFVFDASGMSVVLQLQSVMSDFSQKKKKWLMRRAVHVPGGVAAVGE